MNTLKKLTSILLALFFAFSPLIGVPLVTEGNAADGPKFTVTASVDKVKQGGEFTITVSVDQKISSKGFGLQWPGIIGVTPLLSLL